MLSILPIKILKTIELDPMSYRNEEACDFSYPIRPRRKLTFRSLTLVTCNTKKNDQADAQRISLAYIKILLQNNSIYTMFLLLPFVPMNRPILCFILTENINRYEIVFDILSNDCQREQEIISSSFESSAIDGN